MAQKAFIFTIWPFMEKVCQSLIEYKMFQVHNKKHSKKKKKKKKLGIETQYDPAIPLLGIYPEETKIEKDTYIPLFIAALFTIARRWKQPRCPSTDE